jgi:hypothetical protein
MADCEQHIELAGFRRLMDVERRIWYAPAAFALGGVGLVGFGFMFWSLCRGVVQQPLYLAIGYAIFLAAYGGLFAYYQWYRLSRVKCPGCGQVLQPYVADCGDWPRFRFLARREINGRFFRPPYDEDDRRPWVRLMVIVRGCKACKTYVSCARLHFETCTAAELSLLQQPMRIAK